MEKPLDFTKHEEDLAYGVIHPEEIDMSFDDIGGNEAAIQKLQQVIYVLLNPSTINASTRLLTINSRLWATPPGILLYGPPGCGKTMLARAVAKEVGVRFLAVSLATILDKWVGETEKYLEALFSLARKIAPVIIFIDEIEALTRKRGGSGISNGGGADREWSAAMKSQLLSQWDGLASRRHQERIIILGATNRPQDIDEAFLRRMPLQIKINLPNLSQRQRILEIILGADLIDQYCLNVSEMAVRTEGFSGSDLHELCRRVILDASFAPHPDRISTSEFFNQIAGIRSERTDCFTFH